ncbi:MAG: polysaccharide deacetylase family protein [Opitutales bacterium]
MNASRLIVLSFLTMFTSACTILDKDLYPSQNGKIILSFDDGPSARVSNELLDVLERTETPAAFCYIGKNIEEHPEIVTRAINAGHLMVLHSYEHTLTSLTSTKKLRQETIACIELLESLSTDTDFTARYFRPPLGIKTPAVKKITKEFDLEYAYVTLFVYDAATGPEDAEKVMSKIKDKVLKNNGGAIVLHEMRYKANEDKYAVDKSWLPAAVEEFIHWAKAQGFEFVLYPQESREANPQ